MSTKVENKKRVKGLDNMILLNAEGNILTAYKQGSIFLIMDEYYEIFESLDSDEIYKFTRGDLEIVNSRGEEFNYMKFPGSMKPDLKKLDEFIGVDTTGFSY